MKIAIVGAGWAGMAAAVCAVGDGHEVTVLEASRSLGGRARSLTCTLPDGSTTQIDNGQHILIGAYSETFKRMRQVGVDMTSAFLRMPLTLRFADGNGIAFPAWPAPLDAAAGIALATGWSVADKLTLARHSLRWRLNGFCCAPALSVSELCTGLPLRVMQDLVEPLCVSALNTPARSASAQVFLRVMQDSVFGASGDSNLMLPRQDLSSIFPTAAARWVAQRGATLRLGTRVQHLAPSAEGWAVDGEKFDRVVLAVTAPDAARLVEACVSVSPTLTNSTAAVMRTWCTTANGLQHNPITTVYAWGRGARLPSPMLALRSSADASGPAPAQFVFDRGQLGGPQGLLAFVVSASMGDKEELQSRVLAQAQTQLGQTLQPVQTVVEKRATFACTPGLLRPAMAIAPGLLACGDYVDGPYPATLEGAVRAGQAAVAALGVSLRS